MSTGIPLWLEVIIAALLLLSGAFVLVSALGFVRLRNFFVRMHPPALAYTLGTWSVTLAGILFFSVSERGLRLYPWVIIILLSVSVPMTTVLLARAALFRRRVAGLPDTPPSLTTEREGPSAS